MAFDQGFNFRSTLAFVTDPANTQFVNDTIFYPTTSGGVTFGWPVGSGLQSRDRSTGVDPRVAGWNGISDLFDPVANSRFRVDLPVAGNYAIRLALGDVNYAAASMCWRVLDNTSVLLTATDISTTAPNRYIDTSVVERTSDTDWAANNAAVIYAFATTTFFLEVGDPAIRNLGNTSRVAHLRITLLDAPLSPPVMTVCL